MFQRYSELGFIQDESAPTSFGLAASLLVRRTFVSGRGHSRLAVLGGLALPTRTTEVGVATGAVVVAVRT